ncbi:MAG: hypothetical protein PHX57_14790, partial [Desulfobulbaceae bacterium]|nr:hypothetical protein [Desulfobulbaceae bacterium]
EGSPANGTMPAAARIIARRKKRGRKLSGDDTGLRKKGEERALRLPAVCPVGTKMKRKDIRPTADY